MIKISIKFNNLLKNSKFNLKILYNPLNPLIHHNPLKFNSNLLITNNNLLYPLYPLLLPNLLSYNLLLTMKM